MNKPEILSPAGDMERLKYAIAYGADAVYLAGKHFGMRAASDNFTDDELREGIAYAHARGVKVYVTVNISPRSNEFAELERYLKLLYDCGADAIIVSDLGVIRLAKRVVPQLPLHISTQTSILNSEAAQFWVEMGAERIVLARELTLEEIRTIRDSIPPEVEIECFVHGAMCISYSGRCLISNYTTGRDANHGACAQSCRWKYALMEEKRPGQYFPVEEDARGTYLYNSKDMCMIDHIPALIAAGISSFKIEGRAKTAYYTAGITAAYRRALDAYLANPTPAYRVPDDIREEIGKISHREYFTGFYFGRDPKGQYYPDVMYIRDWEIAALFDSCDADGNAVFVLKNRFFCGDTLELMQPGKPVYAFRVEEMRDDGGALLDAARSAMMRVHLKFPFRVSDFAILRKEKAANPVKKG
ncbi:MAG TPA: U32 family peptidase [Candidatus Butyricicoccus stercorigallinarum]|nr:U32 family peptidase [Candidatus Butyricicoccus stercorigallinarum]